MSHSDSNQSWVDMGKERELSVPDWYGSDSDHLENGRKPKKDEGRYVKSKINFNRYIYWGGIISIIFITLYLSFFGDIDHSGKIVISGSGILGAIFIYFVGKKYVKPEFDADKPVRSLSGRPRFPSGAFSFYSGFVTSLIVDGIRFRVPHHWAFHLLPYDLGEREVEVEIYETKGESYALSIDGFSIQKEAENGLFDVLMDLRRLYVVFVGLILSFCSAPVLADTGALVLIGIQHPADYSPPETWGAVIFQTPTLIFVCVALVLGGPAIWLYVKHRRALSNIKEMYRKEGVIE